MQHQKLLVIDFGSQYSHIIVRRIRELGVLSELLPCTLKFNELEALKPTALILSGGPSSVYEDNSPHAPKEIWSLGIPILGICYGMQEMCQALGGEVKPGTSREFGHASITFTDDSPLGKNLPKQTFDVWMSHGDKVTAIPKGFIDIAHTTNTEHAAVACLEKKFFGLQFHPEVSHTQFGLELLKNFVIGVCGFKQDWSMTSFVEEAIKQIQRQVGPNGRVIGAVSGGVDSTVAAVLLHKAIGDRFHAVLVDNGLLRYDEANEVMKRLHGKMGINLTCVEASQRFLDLLQGVSDPEKKRKIIGNTFIHVFEDEAKKMASEKGEYEFLLQGTLYPDVIESISYKGPSCTIKTHHNVGGLLADMKLKLVEPLRELFKDEVRAVGRLLGIDEESIMRHPFPGPGLSIRILGPVTKEACDKLRLADKIYIEELHKNNLYNKISQAFCVLLPVKSVGVMGDNRTYENVLAVRAVTTTDFMTADWFPMPYDVLRIISTRIINEVKGINRVTYDISSKPPATIEWE